MGRFKYKNPKEIVYRSKRYGKTVTVPEDYLSDGASGPASDIWSNAWWVHDWLCGSYCGAGPKPVGGIWDDGTRLTNWQCSRVLSDILKSEGRWFRSRSWLWGTFLFGGNKARKNGMINLKGPKK